MPDSVPATALPASQPSVRSIFGALLLVMLLASLDQTIVSTALPTIVGEFGGLEHLSWIVTAYMLAQTVATPLYGKLGDLFGRKIVLQSAILLFLIGSVLCGLSRSMGELVAFRAVQGIGGGGLMVSTMAVVGDIIPPRDRGRYQGYFGAVYGLSTVLGPLIGGFFVEHLSWRWIFYINLPLGLVAVGVIAVALGRVERPHQRPAIDIAGAALMAVLLTALVLLTSLGGHTLAWSSPTVMLLGALTLAALAGFIVVEKRAVEPILPLRLFANPTFAIVCLVGAIVSLAMFGAITYLPVYLQVVKHVSPATAGLQLTPMMGGVLLSSIAGGQYVSRFGRYRMVPILGTAVMTLALALLSMLGRDSSTWAASGYALLLGVGIGMVMPVLVVAAQNAVDYKDLGVATAGATLFRLAGGSLGVALFGAIFAATLANALAQQLPPGSALPSAASATAVAALPAAVREIYLVAFTTAFRSVFLTAAAITALAFALSWRLQELPMDAAARSESMSDIFAMPHDATSIEELETIVARMAAREHRWDSFARIAARAGVTLAPDEMWLLGQIYRAATPLQAGDLARAFDVAPHQVDDIAVRLLAQQLVERAADGSYAASASGRATYDRIVEGYRERAVEFLQRWSPEDHAEVKAMLVRFSRDLVAGLPINTVRLPG